MLWSAILSHTPTRRSFNQEVVSISVSRHTTSVPFANKSPGSHVPRFIDELKVMRLIDLAIRLLGYEDHDISIAQSPTQTDDCIRQVAGPCQLWEPAGQIRCAERGDSPHSQASWQRLSCCLMRLTSRHKHGGLTVKRSLLENKRRRFSLCLVSFVLLQLLENKQHLQHRQYEEQHGSRLVLQPLSNPTIHIVKADDPQAA